MYCAQYIRPTGVTRCFEIPDVEPVFPRHYGKDAVLNVPYGVSGKAIEMKSELPVSRARMLKAALDYELSRKKKVLSNLDAIDSSILDIALKITDMEEDADDAQD